MAISGESSLFPPASDLAMVAVTREDFEEAIGRMKGKVDEVGNEYISNRYKPFLLDGRTE